MSQPDEASHIESIEKNVAALLKEAGRSPTFTLEQLKGGRNNRTYRVRSPADDSLLKWYFSHQSDDRDRLGAEFDFGRCLWRHGIRQIAQPLGVDRSVGLGLYDLLPGKPLDSAHVTIDQHDQAVSFLQDVNQLRSEPDALSLPNASEACFSVAAHVERIDRRLQRLETLATVDELDREMVELIRSKLRPVFDRHHAELQREAIQRGIDIQAELPATERCLSPSDFGFHNALIQDDGSLRFVDFEYAGWDDPAKLACDFFCQIEVPALTSAFTSFLGGIAQFCERPEWFVQRTDWLFPFYQINWCCIVLNEFLPTGGARRSFSEPQFVETRRRDQLAVARRMFEQVGCRPGEDC